MKKVNLLVGLSVATLQAFVAFAAIEVNVPNKTGDLADDAWLDSAGGTNIYHGTDTDWHLNTAGASYTVGDDLQFLSLTWSKSATIDLTGETLRTVKLGGTGSDLGIFPGHNRASSDPVNNTCGTLHIRGGLWDLGGWGLRSVKGYNRGRPATLLVSDGAVITNAEYVQVAYQSESSCMRITGGSKVFVKSAGTRFRDGVCTKSLFEVSGGSYFEYGSGANNLYVDNKLDSHHNTNYITGVGTVFTNGNDKAEVFDSRDDLTWIADGAKAYFCGPYFCYQNNSNNEFRVSGTNTYLHVRSTWYASYQGSCHHNLVSILDGASCWVGNLITMNGSDNEFCVSNAAVSCVRVSLDGGTSVRSVLRIHGDSEATVVTCRNSGTSGVAAMFEAKLDSVAATEGNGARLVLAGRYPRLEAPNGTTVYFRNYTTIRFEMPIDGFADRAPVASKSWSSDETTQFEFAGVEEHRKTLTKKTTYTLFETIDDATKTPFNANELARMQAALPNQDRCRVYKQNGKVLLELKPDTGLTLIIR